MLYRVMKGI